MDMGEVLRRAAPVTFVDVDGGAVTIDGAQIDLDGQEVAAGLAELGVRPGDRVGVWLPNGRAYVAVLAACARLGAVAVAVNTRFRAGEVQDIVGRAGCRVLFVHPGFVGIDTEAILGRVQPDAMPALEVVVAAEGAIDTAWPSTRWSELTAHGSMTSDNGGLESPFAVFTTSGTTSAPKLVMHHQRSIVEHAQDVAAGFAIDQDDVAMVTLPFCGVFGLSSLAGAAAGGAHQVVLARFDAAQASRMVSAHGVTMFHATDDMIHRMLEHGGDWSSIRFTGFAPFNNALDDLPERADAQGWPLIGLYGMSEVQALYAHRSVEAPFEERIRSGGALMSPRAQARVCDPDTGEPIDEGEVGELQLRGPSRFEGYLAEGGAEVDAELTGRHFTADGWFRTGDLARMEDDHTFEYLARMGDVLRLGGFLVSPAEIEARILDAEGVDAVQVVAVDGDRGPRVVAFVVGNSAMFDETAVIEHCRSQLAAFKVPRRVLMLESFPMTDSANGMKIQKAKLRRQAADALADG